MTAAPNAALTPLSLSFRGASKSAGKDFAYYSATATAAIVIAVDVKAEPSPLTIKAGEKAKLKVKVTRKLDYKGPVELELKNLPANVTAAKVTVSPDKSEAEMELVAAVNAAVGDKPDVQVTAKATGAANDTATSPNVLLKVVGNPLPPKPK